VAWNATGVHAPTGAAMEAPLRNGGRDVRMDSLQANVTFVGRPPQEFRVHQNIEQRAGGLAVETPQLLELLSGQVKAWHFGKLAANDLQPIRH
jgi:hypothetical protein